MPHLQNLPFINRNGIMKCYYYYYHHYRYNVVVMTIMIITTYYDLGPLFYIHFIFTTILQAIRFRDISNVPRSHTSSPGYKLEAQALADSRGYVLPTILWGGTLSWNHLLIPSSSLYNQAKLLPCLLIIYPYCSY